MAPIPPAIPEIRDVVLAAIVRDRRVLIARRRQQDPFGSYWELPGGKRRPGEAVLDCLAREVMEELGLRIRPGYSFEPIIHAYPDKTVRLLAFACVIDTDDRGPTEPQPLAADCLEWVSADQLPKYRFPGANAPLIAQIVAYLTSTAEEYRHR